MAAPGSRAELNVLTRQARGLAVLSSIGFMAALTTAFQLMLPRLRSEWIVGAIDQHNLLMHGSAGSPWQYRILSDSLIEPLIRVVSVAGSRDPYLYGLGSFVLFRAAQEVCIFGVGFIYYTKLGLGPIASLVGLGVVCAAMVVGQIETSWQLDAYTELALYLLAALLVLSRRFRLVVPIAVLAALNRETGVLIPLMPLACVDVSRLRSPQNLPVYRAVGVGVALFVLVRIGLHLALPSQDQSTRLIPDELLSGLKIKGAWAYLAIALASVPFIGALGVSVCSPFLRSLFWLVVPVWIATHAWGNFAMTPIAFLVPLGLVIVPSALFLVAAVQASPNQLIGSAVYHRETIAAVAMVYLLGPVVAGVLRLNFPFPLERIEGAMLQEVRRVALGQALYVAPSLEYVPLLYGPVYVYVSAGVAALTGVSLLPLRIVSLVSALGSTALVYRLVSSDARGRFGGVLAAALFLGTTQLTPTDRFPARVDALCLLLVLGAVYAAGRADSQPKSAPQLSATCGVLIGLAIVTKQTAVLVAVPLLVLGLAHPRARLLPYAAATGGTLAAATLALLVSSAGWAGFYLVDLPRNHRLDWSMLASLWTDYLLVHAVVALAVGLIGLVVRARRGERGAVGFYALVTTGLVGMSWVGVVNPGGGVNSLPPAYAGVAMLFGLGVPAIAALAQARLPESRALPIGLFLAAALALGMLEYSADQPAPLRANARAGQRLVDAIAALPGPVFAPDVEEFQVRAGKGDHATAAGVQELLGNFGGTTLPEGRQYLDSLDRALTNREYAYVLFDPEGFDLELKDRLTGHGYELVGPLMQADERFFAWRLGASSGGGSLTPSPILYAPRNRPS